MIRLSMRISDAQTIKTAMKGYCRVVMNQETFSPEAFVETINGVNTDNAFFLGGLAEEPSFGSEDELVDFSDNLYGANGPYKGAWNIQSTVSSITGTILKLTPQNLKIIFPDYEDGGDWAGEDDGTGTTPTYGKIVNRSGNVLESAYFDNACLCFEGETDDEVGMIIRVNNVVNRADSKEFSPDGDGNISGVEVQLQGHQDLDTLSTTGEPLPACSFYLPAYMTDAPAA